MMTTEALTILALSLIFLAGCTQTIDLEAEQAALLQADRDWAAAAAEGDLDQLWPFWADDAVLFLSQGVNVQGIDEIQEFVLRNRSQPGFSISWEPEAAVVAASGDLGYTYGVGQRTFTGEDGEPITMTDHYVSIWKKQPDGSWQCVIET